MSNISFLGQEGKAKPLGLGHMNLWKMHVDPAGFQGVLSTEALSSSGLLLNLSQQLVLIHVKGFVRPEFIQNIL